MKMATIKSSDSAMKYGIETKMNNDK